MQKIIPNISIENCKEAIEYYKEVFGGEIKNVQTSDGKEMFKGYEGKIIHAELHINNKCILYFNDNFKDELREGNNMFLILQVESEEEINKLFSELSKNDNVIFPLQKTFWGSLHAVVKDMYGITWSMDYSVK